MAETNMACAQDTGQLYYPDYQRSYIDQVGQAIYATKDALEKLIQERDERDIMEIDNLCSLFHGFDIFPKTVRRALAAQAVLIVIDEEGKELIVHNEELDSFCVLIYGECEQLNPTKTSSIRRYRIGDSFGVCEPTTETIRFVGNMITRLDNCAFLCVKRDDFYTILTDPANYPSRETIRHRDHLGNISCISQPRSDKKSSYPLWSQHRQTLCCSHRNHCNLKTLFPDSHVIVKATETFMLYSLVDGYEKIDPEYIDDFLLLFRVFMSQDIRGDHLKDRQLPPGMMKLCQDLCDWLEEPQFSDKVVKIVLTWLSSYYHDFELNPDFSYQFFKIIESRLEHYKLFNQLHLLRVTLSTKSKIRHVTISKPNIGDPGFKILGGYEKNCGIFVTQVDQPNCDNYLNDRYLKYFKYPNPGSDSFRTAPAIPPRLKVNHNNTLYNQDNKTSIPLRPGDQILEVNGTNFAAIKLDEARNILRKFTHLSLTVKYNPSAYNEMIALPEGRRKSSLSSISSVSPFLSTGSQSKFTFNTQDPSLNQRQSDLNPPPSPLFSQAANFGFKSLIKQGHRGDKSRLSSLINSSKQFVKQIRDSTSTNNNIETMSKTSGDNASDTQSNELDIGKSKSNPDLPSMRTRPLDSGLSNIVKIGDCNINSIFDQANGNSSPALVNVLKVFNAANNEFRYLLVHEETTAREVVMVAVKEFNLTTTTGSQTSTNDKASQSSLDWYLYEVSVEPESRTFKQKRLSEQTSHLANGASLCSRFYIKNNSQSSFGSSRIDMSEEILAAEILKESPANVTLTSLNATLLAVELTLSDFDKFRSIEPQQFIYDTFFDYSDKNTNHSNGSSSADSLSLKSSSSDGQEADRLHLLNKSRSIPKSWMREYQEFADISNKEMFWVVCEILNERNISRRVKIVKQFVRVADVCSQLRNYNSMFAIISGLGHSCVGRLKRTFEKLKPKYKNQLEKMRCLFDPSKNMSNYRICLGQTPPPAIPLFPQIKKDLTFSKEGRAIFVRESNDISDDEDSAEFHQNTIRRKIRHQAANVVLSKPNVISNAGPCPNSNYQQHPNCIQYQYQNQHHYSSYSHQIPEHPYTTNPHVRYNHHHDNNYNLNLHGTQNTQSSSATIIGNNNHINSGNTHPPTARPRLSSSHQGAHHRLGVVMNDNHANNYGGSTKSGNSNTDSAANILVNFAEIRQFTERIRNVIYLSSVPYSNDLLTNTKEQQRNQAQIKKMHEEWQMRKRIRHYISEVLDKAAENSAAANGHDNNQDQTDGPNVNRQNGSHGVAPKLVISYDERSLYQRSLDIEPDLMSSRPQQPIERPVISSTRQEQQVQKQQLQPNHGQAPSLPPPLPPPMQLMTSLTTGMHPHTVQSAAMGLHLPTASNSSPTLSKSSSLSSCSSFNHHLPSYHVARGNLTSSVGKFGTESTESLRKLQALSENIGDWRPYHEGSGGSTANSGFSNSHNRFTAANRANSMGDQQQGGGKTKGLVPSRIFPAKGNR